MKDEWDTETYYFSWLGLDLWLKLSVPERITQGHNDPLLYHQRPHCAEVHKPERGRYSFRHIGGLQIKTGIST